MFTLAVNYGLEEFVVDILRKRFPGDPNRQKINLDAGDKLNFACPYCGDSTHDSNKKRGNLYLTTQTYKCFNDGCAIRVSLEKFISKFSQKYLLNLPEVGPKKIEFTPTASLNKKGFLIEFLINQEVGKKLLRFDEIASRFSLMPCKDADPAGPIGSYVFGRRKLNLMPLFEKSCYYDSRQDKIYLFNLDLKSGRVLGFALRYIDDSYPGPKYNIKNYSEFKKTGLIQNLEDEFIEKVNTINNYFNLLNIDFKSDVTITEGQIDAMFIRNCIATTGVTKSKQLLGSLITKERSRILFDSDSAGRKESLNLLKQGYRVFLWQQLFHDLRKKYPHRKREISADQIKDINDLFKFLLQEDLGLDFSSFNLFIDLYFSNSAFDLLLV